MRSRPRSPAPRRTSCSPTTAPSPGNATCNTLSGSYEVDGETLTFGPLATTQMACTEMGASEQEAAVLAGLEATRSFAIEGDVLTLAGEDGAMLLQYRGA